MENRDSEEFLKEIDMPMEALDDDEGDDEEFHESLRITLNMDDGTEVPCEVLGLFALDEAQYMALYRLDKANGDVAILPYEGDAEGNVCFREFEDEDEYEAAAAEFDRLFNGEIMEAEEENE